MIVPTGRTVALAVLAAPIAVLIAAMVPGAWIFAPAAALAIMVLVLLDAMLAGRLGEWRIIAPADTEVGEPMTLGLIAEFPGRQGSSAVEAAMAIDPRLAEDGRAVFPLVRKSDGHVWEGRADLIPGRRGTAPIEQLWLRWAGPLGLGYRQQELETGQAIRIWPDLAPVRSPQLQTYLRDAQFGLIARRIRGEGTQFEALAEYEPGMDRRRIDWKSSARMTRLYARENESERNNQIVFAMDCGQAMCEPVDGLPRIDRAVSAALTAAYVALKGGDKVALFGFARQVELATPFATETRAFHRLQSAAATLDYRPEEPNFTLALATLATRLQRRSLIVLFSDFTDPTAAEQMVESVGRLVRHHLVLFVTLEDTELSDMTDRAPETLGDLAVSVTADTLARQRAVVLERLRRLGVDVIEAPYDAITYRLIDRYFEIKRSEAIG